jgi:hypothetical protein
VHEIKPHSGIHQNFILGDWQKVIIDSMKQVDPSTRSRSVEALPAFCEQFCRDPNGVILERQLSLISILLESLTSLQAETTRMGFCRALGTNLSNSLFLLTFKP